jgi:hypothetical protein
MEANRDMARGEVDGTASGGEADIVAGMVEGAGMDTVPAGAGKIGSAARAGTGVALVSAGSEVDERGWSAVCSATLS